jgi:[ribosomal protein S5]-alanine N-acetyltransferase
MNLKLRTERLEITAFNQENYKKISETYPLGTHIVKHIENLKNDPELYGWGVWFVTISKNSQVIGDTGFKGKPDNQGVVEFGYGIIPEMHNKGFATESVQAILNWALSSNKVEMVKAECLEDNIPSIKVLEKLGMKRVNSINGMINWEKRKFD